MPARILPPPGKPAKIPGSPGNPPDHRTTRRAQSSMFEAAGGRTAMAPSEHHASKNARARAHSPEIAFHLAGYFALTLGDGWSLVKHLDLRRQQMMRTCSLAANQHDGTRRRQQR